MSNKKLIHARVRAADEYYTRLEDIEAEVSRYAEELKGKSIHLNCDNPFVSNFFRFFVLNFQRFGLKRLVATCFAGTASQGVQVALFHVENDITQKDEIKQTPWFADVTTVPEELLKDVPKTFTLTTTPATKKLSPLVDESWRTVVKALVKIPGNSLTELQGDGDFRSQEVQEITKQCDLVITNPPFSLSRDWVKLMMKLDRKFLVIGNLNLLGSLDAFGFWKQGKIWVGETVPDGFITPNGEQVNEKLKGLTRWYTNLPNSTRHREFVFQENYSPEKHPHYLNYDAIDVTRMRDLPGDYFGVMGVPITFIDHFNPDKFEILGKAGHKDSWGLRIFDYPEKQMVEQKVGKHSVKSSPVILVDGEPKLMYQRIFIRRKPEVT